MAQLNARQPSKTYRGTIEEVLRHRDEISPGATVELNVFEDAPETDLFGGKSLADLINEIGTVKGLPSDLAVRSEEYLQGFGETNNRRTLK